MGQVKKSHKRHVTHFGLSSRFECLVAPEEVGDCPRSAEHDECSEADLASPVFSILVVLTQNV